MQSAFNRCRDPAVRIITLEKRFEAAPAVQNGCQVN
jgi:hypothetical protein